MDRPGPAAAAATQTLRLPATQSDSESDRESRISSSARPAWQPTASECTGKPSRCSGNVTVTAASPCPSEVPTKLEIRVTRAVTVPRSEPACQAGQCGAGEPPAAAEARARARPARGPGGALAAGEAASHSLAAAERRLAHSAGRVSHCRDRGTQRRHSGWRPAWRWRRPRHSELSRPGGSDDPSRRDRRRDAACQWPRCTAVTVTHGHRPTGSHWH
jgi:hypothetical protein